MPRFGQDVSSGHCPTPSGSLGAWATLGHILATRGRLHERIGTDSKVGASTNRPCIESPMSAPSLIHKKSGGGGHRKTRLLHRCTKVQI